MVLRVRRVRQQKPGAEQCCRRSKVWGASTNMCRILPARYKRWEIVRVKSIISSRLLLILRTRRTVWRLMLLFRLLWQVRMGKALARLLQTFDAWQNAPKTRPVQLHVLYVAYVKISELWQFQCEIQNERPRQVHS